MQLLLSEPAAGTAVATAQVIDSQWQIVDAEETDAGACAKDQAVAISLSQYLSDPEAWHGRGDLWTVVVQPDDELFEVPQALLERPEIFIAFPVFTDGRGYSHAATLKQHHGYSGRLIATGDVRRDQLEFMRETGITGYEITGKDTVDDMIRSLSELAMPEHRLYSGAALPTATEARQ